MQCSVITYSRSKLFEVGKSCLQLQLPIFATERIAALGIAASSSFSWLRHKPTYRGTRGGTRKQRQIGVISNRRPHKPPAPRPPSCLVSLQKHKPNYQSHIALWNDRSVVKKTTSITEYVMAHQLEMIFFTETWMKDSDTNRVVIGELTPPGYSFINHPRPNDAHGGLGILHKSDLHLSVRDTGIQTVMFEHCCVMDTKNGVRYVLVYRPPPSTENGFTKAGFLSEFDNFIDEISTHPGKLVLLGDFNIHVDTPEESDARHFLTTLATSGLHQHVTEVTHKKGHVLDLVITPEGENHVLSCEVKDVLMSDHYLVDITVNQRHSQVRNVTKTSRNFCKLVVNNFLEDLSSEFKDFPYQRDVDTQLDFYNTTCTKVLDVHCPEVTRKIKERQHFPWFNDNVRVARKLKRRCERKFRKSKLDTDRQKYLEQKIITDKVIQEAKADYFKGQLEGADAKTIFATLNGLLNKNARPLPDDDDPKALSEKFSKFFVDKIQKIRAKLDSAEDVTTETLNCPDELLPCTSTATQFCGFSDVSSEEISKLVSSRPNKTCSLDPIPTWLLKSCMPALLHPLTSIVNSSLSSGQFPEALREAVVTPVIKKPSLDKNVMKNYRPVSNIALISKLIEKPAIKQLQDHLTNHDLNEPLQSAYKVHHSTETTLMKVQADILQAIGDRKAVLLVMLDLSAAFDTVDHDLLIHRLSSRLNIKDTGLEWVRSYLSDRKNRVCIAGESSATSKMKFGMPQGSVVGPWMFTNYILPIGDIIKRYGLSYHLYADDSQIYISFNPKNPGDAEVCLFKIRACIQEIKRWMAANKLKLNDEKTEFFIAAHQQDQQRLSGLTLQLDDDNKFSASSTVRNLGVVFDTNMQMSDQVSAICRTVNFHLSNLWRIRRFIDKDTCAHAARALIISRLDYCNSLLNGISKYDSNRLQRLQNKAAKLVFALGRREHVTPLLKDLHWLRMEERVKFKVLLHIFKCLHDQNPSYLKEAMILYTPGHPGLRSNLDTTRLVTPKRAPLVIGNRSFFKAGPRIWNLIPAAIRSAPSINVFKKQLKTHLFAESYPD